MPVALAPIGLAGLIARRGEVQAARAASAAGIPFCLSTVSACSLEEVATARPGPDVVPALHDPGPRLHARSPRPGSHGSALLGLGVHRRHARARISLS